MSIKDQSIIGWASLNTTTKLCILSTGRHSRVPYLSGGSRISQRRGRQLPMWGHQPIIWSKFSRKLHENERIWTQRRGRASLVPPLDPPMPYFPLCLTRQKTMIDIVDILTKPLTICRYILTFRN